MHFVIIWVLHLLVLDHMHPVVPHRKKQPNELQIFIIHFYAQATAQVVASPNRIAICSRRFSRTLMKLPWCNTFHEKLQRRLVFAPFSSQHYSWAAISFDTRLKGRISTSSCFCLCLNCDVTFTRIKFATFSTPDSVHDVNAQNRWFSVKIWNANLGVEVRA